MITIAYDDIPEMRREVESRLMLAVEKQVLLEVLDALATYERGSYAHLSVLDVRYPVVHLV